MNFIGCDKCFCRDHGFPHFSGLMVNPSKVYSDHLNIQVEEDEEILKERIKNSNI